MKIKYPLGSGTVRGNLGCVLRDMVTGLGERRSATFHGFVFIGQRCFTMPDVLTCLVREHRFHDKFAGHEMAFTYSWRT